MTIEESINHPKVNAFDIISEKGTTIVRTFRKPEETDEEYILRNKKNIAFSNRLKTQKPH